MVEVVIYLYVLPKQCTTIMAMPTLQLSSLVECIEWVSYWLWTNSAYVCIAAIDACKIDLI